MEPSSATAVQGRIWAFGDQHQALVFDPATNEWSDAARYARPGMSWYAPIAISSDRILVVSGSAGPAGAGADTILVGAESANGRTAVWISA